MILDRQARTWARIILDKVAPLLPGDLSHLDRMDGVVLPQTEETPLKGLVLPRNL